MNKRKSTYKKGKCICVTCGIEFEKPLNEIVRSEKINRKHFCSRNCAGKYNVKNFGDRKNNYDISKHSNNRGDKYSKFRYHFRNIIKRNKIRNIEIDITIEDLINQWEKQRGICEFTGLNLVISSYSKIEKNPIYSASLDRIDSSKGYTKDNIRWISRSINYMKNDMTDEMTWNLIDILIENKKRGS